MRTALFVAASLLAASASAASYHVGNSLTWDGLGHESQGRMGIARVAEAAGLSFDPFYHVRCSWPLPAIWGDPSSVCIPSLAPYGRFDSALPNYDWELVTLQPHAGATLAGDAQAVLSFIELARSAGHNASTPFYIYQTWPQTTWGAYDDVWQSPASDDDLLGSEQRRDYFTHLYGRVAAETPVRMIPAGEVLFALHERWQAGELPGVDSFADFYRDSIHLSSLGMYVAEATILAATKHASPLALNDSAIDPATVATINETVREVLLADPRVGLTDFNFDGVVDAGDLALWNAGDAAADATLDGVVDGADLLAWQRDLSPIVEAPAAVAAIPEPLGFWLFAFAAARLFQRRR